MSDGHGDVTFQLELDTVVQWLQEDLTLPELDENSSEEEANQLGPRRSCRARLNTKDLDY